MYATQSLPGGDAPLLREPYTRLMVAVLQTVVDDCMGTLGRRTSGYDVSPDPQRVRDAIAYLRSTDRAWPFSFENLCDALGLDAGRLRRELYQRGDT